MTSYLLMIVGTVLVNNIVLTRMLGLCPFMGVSRRLATAIGMGAATTFVVTLATGLTYMVDTYLLGPPLAYLQTLAFIVVIAGVVQFTEMYIHKASPALYQALGIYLPLITTNCAVLGYAILNINEKHNLAESLVYGFGGSLGFALALVLFASLRERLEAADVPAPFKGAPIALVTAGLLSLAFLGFSGLVR
jgi:electron transport complex protein RnfA